MHKQKESGNAVFMSNLNSFVWLSVVYGTHDYKNGF